MHRATQQAGLVRMAVETPAIWWSQAVIGGTTVYRRAPPCTHDARPSPSQTRSPSSQRRGMPVGTRPSFGWPFGSPNSCSVTASVRLSAQLPRPSWLDAPPPPRRPHGRLRCPEILCPQRKLPVNPTAQCLPTAFQSHRSQPQNKSHPSSTLAHMALVQTASTKPKPTEGFALHLALHLSLNRDKCIVAGQTYKTCARVCLDAGATYTDWSPRVS